MSNHTPGPWTVGEEVGHETGLFAVNVLFENGPHIGISGPADALGASLEQAFANAKLIAAAPDLLEALEQVQTALACYRDNLPIPNSLSLEEIKYVVVDAAIAKATSQPVSA